MAPNIKIQLNEGSEATPSWTTIDTAARWTGPSGVGDAFPAPIGDGDDAFFDGSTSPNDGELWHDTTTDAQVDEAGRNTNDNALRIYNDTGGSATADPPVFTAFDDASDAASRTNPSVWILVGTSGTSNVSCMRAIETTVSSPGSDWQNQVHNSAPGEGNPLDGDQTGEKVTCASALGATPGEKTLNLAACAPHDATAGLTNFVYAVLYTYE